MEIYGPPMEEWRSVVGYEGLYDVSSYGRVRRLVERHNVYCKPLGIPEFMKTKPRAKYVGIDLSRDGKKWCTYVHVLVTMAFHGPRPAEHQVAHDDGVTSHNHETNLSWKTVKANHADKRRHGTHLQGEDHYGHRLTEREVKEIRADRRSTPSVARAYGMSRTAIQQVRNRSTWKHV